MNKTPWWDEDENSVGDCLANVVDDLRGRDEARRTAIRVWDDLYDGRANATQAVDPYGVLGRSGIEIPSVNVTRNIIDFVHAKVTAEPPAIRADTHGGEWSQVRRAIKLTRAISGLSKAVGLDANSALALNQALRTGTGLCKVVERHGTLALEVVSAREFLVDPDDGRHGQPRCLYQVKPVDPAVLVSEFPDLEDLIQSTGGTSDPMVGGLADPWSLTANDQGSAVDLYEGWYLPGPDPKKDRGRHVLCLRGVTLVDEDWDVPRFPVGMLRPTDPRPGGGLWGQGFVERLVPLQYEINETIAAINKAERLTQLRVFMGDKSEITDEDLEDPAIGHVIRYSGAQVPVFHTPNGVSQQKIDWLKQQIDWAYSMFGMDEQSASSNRPAGVNSGRAILYFHDLQTQRHVDLAKRFGVFVTDVVDRLLDAARRMAKQHDPDSSDDDGGAAPPMRSQHPALRDIDWDAVEMDRAQFVLELEETSDVPDTFAGRLQQVDQDVQEGRLPAEDLIQMRQDPDLERRWDAASADGEFVDWAVEELLETDRPMPPVIDEMDAALMTDRLRAEIQRTVMSKGVDPEVLDRLRRYASDVAAANVPPPPPPQAQAPAGPGAPAPFVGGVGAAPQTAQ